MRRSSPIHAKLHAAPDRRARNRLRLATLGCCLLYAVSIGGDPAPLLAQDTGPLPSAHPPQVAIISPAIPEPALHEGTTRFPLTISELPETAASPSDIDMPRIWESALWVATHTSTYPPIPSGGEAGRANGSTGRDKAAASKGAGKKRKPSGPLHDLYEFTWHKSLRYGV